MIMYRRWLRLHIYNMASAYVWRTLCDKSGKKRWCPKLCKTLVKHVKSRFRRGRKTITSRGYQRTCKNHGNTSFWALGKKTIRPVVEGPPVQVGFRTMGNHWKINNSVGLSHVSIASPLERGLGSRGFLKTLKIIGKSMFWAMPASKNKASKLEITTLQTETNTGELTVTTKKWWNPLEKQRVISVSGYTGKITMTT